MGDTVDVKALRAKFSSNAKMDGGRSPNSGSPQPPPHGGPRGNIRAAANGDVHHKLLTALPAPPPGLSSSSGQKRISISPRVEQPTNGSLRSPAPPVSSPRPHSPPSLSPMEALLPVPQFADQSKVKLTSELLRTRMMKTQGPPGSKLPPPNPRPGPSLPQQRSLEEVSPLRRHLPPMAPRPPKPKRPPFVNLEPHRRTVKPRLPAPGNQPIRKSAGPTLMGGRSPSLPGIVSPSVPPKPSSTAHSLPRQFTHMHVESNQDTYDDIGSSEGADSWNDSPLPPAEGESDESEIYDIVDDENLESQRPPNKKAEKDLKRRQEQERREQKERQKKEMELKKKFKLNGEIEVLHLARVRHDWQGGKLDLSVRQGDSVEILRVKNNPGGKWLARTPAGSYGYISNTCVDVDYEEVKRRIRQSHGKEQSPSLPPPPPSPPVDEEIYCDVDAPDELSQNQDDYGDYDDIQAPDFPPPPPEICLDNQKIEKELKKKFKFEGPVKVLHTMMVDPNARIKKPGSKDLAVTQGEILDLIQLTDDKKALCRNNHNKFGYVSRALLLPMEGDIYDDVDNLDDVYDND